MDSGSGFTPILGDPTPQLLLAHTQTSGISSGQTYVFRFRAANIYGWSEYSPTASIVAATVPTAPTGVGSNNVGTQIVITWDAPSNSGGNGISIDQYAITIQGADGVYRQDSTACNGAEPTITASRSCEVPMSHLLAAPFSLAQGSEVDVLVQGAQPSRLGTIVSPESCCCRGIDRPTSASLLTYQRPGVFVYAAHRRLVTPDWLSHWRSDDHLLSSIVRWGIRWVDLDRLDRPFNTLPHHHIHLELPNHRGRHLPVPISSLECFRLGRLLRRPQIGGSLSAKLSESCNDLE